MDQVFVQVVEGILGKLISRAGDEIRIARGFKVELQRLSKRLKTAELLLSDAENRKKLVSLEVVHDWLKRLKAVALKAEDVVDEFAYEGLRRKIEVQNRMRNKVRNFFSLSNPIAFRFKMAHKVNNVNLSFDEIYKEAINDLGFRPVEIMSNTPAVEPTGEIRLTHPFVDHNQIKGREKDVSIVVDYLLGPDINDHQHLPAVAIVGMPGMGKTTVAQLVYKDEKVVRTFGEERLIWVCVSNDFGVKTLLNKMLHSLHGTESETLNVEGAIRELREKLQGKRFLLVLDDVWNKNKVIWGQFINALFGINGDRGSKILVTTRSCEVVDTIQAPLVHCLKGLSDDDCWKVFEKKAFEVGGPMRTPSLEDIGRRIVKRCGGVPLAVMSLGGLMYSKKHQDEWLLIEDSEIWNSPESNNDMIPALMLSFDNLPSPNMKQCFAYCAIFPKDYDIERDKIIQLWMAQGYLQPSQGSKLLMEDVGRDYFDVLLWNSLLQDVRKDEYDNIISCKMHDLVHDLALLVAKNNILTSKATGLTNVDPEIQHLSLIFEDEEDKEFKIASHKGLRTLILEDGLVTDVLGDFKGLRTLWLSGFSIEKLPESIGKLKSLRNLDVSWTCIRTLPHSFCKLYNLQTLNILRCVDLEELPKDFQKLVSLRHFHVDDTAERRNSMPTGIGQLSCLQTLPFFVVGQEDGCRIEELGCLNNLRGDLNIYCLEQVRGRAEAQKANLLSKPYIQKLYFKWSWERENNNDDDVLQGLQPHKRLKSLRIGNFSGKQFASWIMMASYLVEIVLDDCNRCEQLPTLGHLLCLKVVRIIGMKNVKRLGAEFYGHVSHNGKVFPSLKALFLWNMPELVEWLEAEEHVQLNATIFPCLENLVIEDCQNLVTVPSHFPSVKELKIDGLKNSSALDKLSSTLNSVEKLDFDSISGSELNLILERMVANNVFLTDMSIRRCDRLLHLTVGPQNSASLKAVLLFGCFNLYGLEIPPSLEKLDILDCPKLVDAKFDPHERPSLKYLSLPRLEMLTNDWSRLLLSLSGLTRLTMGPFSEDLDYFPWPAAAAADGDLYPLVSLEHVLLTGWEEVKSLPEQLQYLRALKSLQLLDFKGLESLPEWIGNLSSLQDLSISGALKLMNLPANFGRLTNLQRLGIVNCPNLKESCRKESGSDWHKISHVSIITIDFEHIFPGYSKPNE